MDITLIFALLLNLALAMLEIYTLSGLKRKLDIVKYYTYLQNFLALVVSIIFAVCLFINVSFYVAIPTWVKGLRYIVTTGLTVTSIVYALFLSRGNNAMTQEDFHERVNPKTANLLLHYICPAISVLSFLAFERSLILTNGIWTLLVIIPSALYWLVYLVLTVAKLWTPPYDFSSSAKTKGGSFGEVLSALLIPLSFIGVSFLLWNVM